MPARREEPASTLWSVPVAVAEVPEHGLDREIEADAAARAAIAAAAGLRDVTSLLAEFHVSPMAGGCYRVEGHVSAVVGQNCVVTLEPLDSAIEEDVDLVFSPDVPEAPEDEPDGEEFDANAEDPPEPLVNGRIDLGMVAVEFMVLGINPYPRKEDAVFEPPSTPSDPQEHPFAALQALKDKPLKS